MEEFLDPLGVLGDKLDRLIAKRDTLDEEIHELEQEKEAIISALTVIQNNNFEYPERIFMRQMELKAYDKATYTMRASYAALMSSAQQLMAYGSNLGGNQDVYDTSESEEEDEEDDSEGEVDREAEDKFNLQNTANFGRGKGRNRNDKRNKKDQKKKKEKEKQNYRNTSARSPRNFTSQNVYK